MTSVKWKLENLINKSIILIEKCEFFIGRSSKADLSTQSIRISRKHATIQILSSNELSVSDHKSTNGTFVNNEQITDRVLRDGDILSFGGTEELVNSEEFEKAPFLFKVVKIENLPSDLNTVNKKKEKNNTNKDPKKDKPLKASNFTTLQDECIIISDTEEDDYSLSQIYQITEKIKEEPDDPESELYHCIKEELEELDCCSPGHVINVDLTNEIDHFESTSDLLEVLDSEKSTKESLIDILEDENLYQPENVTNENQLDKKSKELKVVINNCQETAKYFLTPVKTPNEAAEKKLTKKPTKRKSLDGRGELEILNTRKKRRHSTSGAEDHHKKEIRQLRKEKLKELASKTDHLKSDRTGDKIENKESSVNEVLLTVPQKIKFSNIEYSSINQPSTSTATQSTKDVTSKRSPPKKNTRSNKLLPNPCSINKIPEIKDTNKIQLGTSNQKNADPRLRNQIYIQDATVSSNAMTNNNMVWLKPDQNRSKTIPDSTVRDDERSGLLWRISNNQNVRQPVVNNRRIEINEEIKHILQWNVGWLLEQKNCDISAPVNFEKEYVHVPLVFENFGQYVDVWMPLLRLELWQYIYQMTFEKEERRTPFKVLIQHERRSGEIIYLDCEYVRSSTNNQLMPFRVEDFCLLELKVKDSENVYIYTCFGYISSVNNRQNNGGSMTVMVKKFNKIIQSQQFLIKICANISSNIKLIKTIKYLEYSPLCEYVLKPQTLANVLPIKNVSAMHAPLLNMTQKDVCSQASELILRNTPGFYLIKGPPGTGKSTVIVATILEIMYKCKMNKIQPRILLTAPSNAAIDGLILKLYRARMELPANDRKLIKLVRIGPDSSVNELVNKSTLKFQARKAVLLEKRLIHLPDYKKVVDNEMDIDDFLKLTLGNQYYYDNKVTEDRVLFGANIICTTLNSAISYALTQPHRKTFMKYTCCIIDEATQCNEIECLLPIQLDIDKIVLVGDPQQLPGVVYNKEAQQLGFGKSLFSRLAENLTKGHYQNRFPLRMLDTQYRMKHEICQYPNRTFYQGQLKSLPRCLNPIYPALTPYLLFNINNCDNNNKDYTNPEEAELIKNLLEILNVHVNSKCEFSIGIITPYRAQKEVIAQHVTNIKFNSRITVTVNTVDSFQGKENDVIIISCVRYSTNCFLANEQRLNVALTRAKQALYIVGNYNLFKECRPLYDLREDAKRRKLVLDIKTNIGNVPLKTFIFSK